MKKYYILIILFLSLFLFTNKVNAETYQLEPESFYVNVNTAGTFSQSSFGTLHKIGTASPVHYINQFQAQVQSVGSDKSDNNPVIFPGQYLVEFYLFGIEVFNNINCTNLTSNFSNINMITGGWVSNEISSNCVGVYKTTYNGYYAYRILYKFNYKGSLNATGADGITEMRFNISSSKGFITPTSDGLFYGLSVSNIQPYNQSIVDSFKSDENDQLIINQNDHIINQNTQTNNKLDTQIQQNTEAETTRKGIWESLKTALSYINPLSENFFAYKLVELIVNALKALFIPENMDFVTDFVDALESKLGFIASVPVAIIEFIMDLANATWTEFKSIQLPSISIFGYNFWNAQEIDLTEAINIFKPFKYVTDVICVVICAQTLNKWRERFSGGGAGK